MMNEKLEWTEKLGNAFLGQQKDVMASVQRLRQKAQESGNLKTTKEQKVVVEKETKVIVIESASPQVVYVPTYNPTVVYGAWPYPAYPPAPVYPPGYVAATAAFSFAAGVAIGAAASGYGAWGCGWGNNEVNINVSTNNNFTKNNYNNPQKYQDETRIRTGSITRSTGGMPSIRIRQRLRSMGSRVRVEAPDQAPQRPEGTAVAQVRKVAEGLRPATSVVGVVRKAAEGHKPATPVEAGGKRAL